MTAQEVFDKTVEAYDSAKAVIKTLSDKAAESDPEFSFEFAMGEFDSVLQSIMLAVAATDGELHVLERQFIEKLTEYVDITDIYAQATGEKLTWDMIARMDKATMAELTMNMLKVNDYISGRFVEPFAKIDAAESRDYLGELLDSILFITGVLAMVDGDGYDSAQRKAEYHNATGLISSLILEKWEAVTGLRHDISL